MFQLPDYNISLSLKLSEVMEDIGVNENMVMRRRMVFMLMENIDTVADRLSGKSVTTYSFGSQSEGTTTLGLNSDIDVLTVDYDFNVMQDWSEWKLNKNNYLMIQDENVTPGYCFLQLLRSDVPLPGLHIPDKYHTRDRNGRILLRNTFVTSNLEEAERHGPSNSVSGIEGYVDNDFVYAFPCSSCSRVSSTFLERQNIGRWLSPKIIRYAASNGCFVVGASSKISPYPDLEWRISTSLTERTLMFNLNITQIQCYVLMKIILKTLLNPRKENCLSSFMCKTVLLHCIKKSERQIWKRNNLSTCLSYCFLELHSCIENDNCPHLIIPENNLMAGQFNVEVKSDLLKKTRDIIQSDGRYLLRINSDDISHRLQVKLYTCPYIVHNFLTPRELQGICSSFLYIDLVRCISASTFVAYSSLLQYNSIKNLNRIICQLTTYHIDGNIFEQHASRYLIPIFCSTLGSLLASSCIGRNNPVSPNALSWLSLGFNSDATSGRLKLATVFYCAGDMLKAEFLLRQTERQYRCSTVVPICTCTKQLFHPPSEFIRICTEKSLDCIKDMTSYCVRFLPNELHCVPHEVQYEMTRSTRDDMPYRIRDEKIWMNYAVIDSPPYLYFLQYKTYSRLQRIQEQQHALMNLMKTTLTGANFGHRETALNLLGKCMEQEGKPRKALQCYKLSLQQRAKNNAAKFHICSLLERFARHL